MLKVFTFFLMISGLSFAQISITAQDMDAAYAVGVSYTTHSDTILKQFNLGSTGSTSWNFSNIGLTSHLSSVTNIISTSSAPEIGRFPGTNRVFKSIQNVGGQGSADAYMYYTFGANELAFNGAWTEMNIGVVVNTFIKSHPKDVLMVFPYTYNSTWQSTYVDSIFSIMGGMVLGTDVENMTDTYLVDAYGPCTFPDGVTENALRYRNTSVMTDQSGSQTQVDYVWLSKTGRMLSVDCVASNPPNSGTVQVSDIDWQTMGVTSVEENQIPSSLQLEQNYPNPFNPSTVIQFSLPNSGHTTLKVFNILGVEVAELVNGFRSAGQYNSVFDAAGLSAGVYFARLQSGNHIQTIKMNLLK